MRDVDYATQAAIDAVGKAHSMPADQRREYLEMLGHVSVKYMRAIGGDDYVRGWLDAALAELDHPSIFDLRKAN